MLALVLFVALASAATPEQADNVLLWPCDGSIGQQWLRPDTNQLIRLASSSLNLCLDIEAYGTTPGSNVWAYAPHLHDKLPSHQNQAWTYHPTNSSITAKMSGLCLGVLSTRPSLASNVELVSCTDSSVSKRWTYNSSDLSWRLGEALCLDVGHHPSCASAPWSAFHFCNSSLTARARAVDLVTRLRVNEKVRLMVADSVPGIPRLAVPVFGHTECAHGTFNNGEEAFYTTLFPAPISSARSFSTDLLHAVGRAISDEVRAKSNLAEAMKLPRAYPNGLVCWAPVVNLNRHPTWGRAQETMGESPFLTGELARAYVRAIQNADSGSPYIQSVATCKHFDAHSGPENLPVSRMTFDAQVSYRDWIDSYLPAFKACGEEALSFMCSYNAINGVPACANSELMEDILRTSWNWTEQGYVVSDCQAIRQVYTDHHFGNSVMEAAVMSVRAGVDWNCGTGFEELADAVAKGILRESTLDRSVTRLATTMFQLGLFDPPDLVPWSSLNMSVVAEHEGLARRAAREAIVLLRNDNDTLPLDFANFDTVAIIGPCADNTDCPRGDYDPQPPFIITPYHAFSSIPTFTKVVTAPGCDNIFCKNSSGFAHALELAATADLVVFSGGLSKYVEREGTDRADLQMPGFQEDLLAKLFSQAQASGATFVVALNHGGVVASDFAGAPAVLSVGYGGMMAGAALTDVMNGTYAPSGRTANTWYKSIDQVPPMVDYNMTALPAGRTFRYFRDEPLYPFGFGRFYSSFDYTDPVPRVPLVDPCDTVNVTVSVKNTGSRASDHSVPLFISFRNSTVIAPLYSLAGFSKVYALAPGRSHDFEFEISPEQRAVTGDYSYSQMLEPGTFELFAGGLPGSGMVVTTTTFVQRGPVTPLKACDVVHY